MGMLDSAAPPAADALVEVDVMRLYDRYLVEHPWLALAVGSDLNVYAPVHARRLCSDWNGDPSKDRLATGSSGSSPTTRCSSGPTATDLRPGHRHDSHRALGAPTSVASAGARRSSAGIPTR